MRLSVCPYVAYIGVEASYENREIERKRRRRDDSFWFVMETHQSLAFFSQPSFVVHIQPARELDGRGRRAEKNILLKRAL